MRRLVRSSRGPGSDRAYVTVLLVLVTGAPIVTVSMQMLNSVDATSLSIIASGAALLLAVVAVLIPTGFGPVSASESEIWFLVDGPIGPGAVLRPRVFLCMAIAVMFLATVGTGVAVARAGTAAEGAALGALLGLALGSTAVLAATATTPARRAIIALGCAAVVTVFSQSVVMVGVSATTLGLAAMVCLGGTVIAAIRVGRVPVSLLLVGTEHRASASAALFVGDLGIVTRAIRPGRLRARSRPTVFRRGVLARTVDRDVLGLRRMPWSAGLGSLTIVAGVGCTSLSASVPLLWGVGVVLGQLGCLPLTTGLRDRAGQFGADELEPEPFGLRLASHLAVPALIVALASAVGGGVALVVGHAMALPTSGVAAAPLVGATVLGIRLWLAGAGAAPLWVMSPVASPLGELSSLVFVSWMCRGGIPAVGGTLVAASAGPWNAGVIAMAFVVVLALVNVRSLSQGVAR